MGTRENGEGDDSTLPPHPPCPFCDRADTRLISPFGGQLTVATYWCNRCRTGFDYIKWEDEIVREGGVPGSVDPGP